MPRSHHRRPGLPACRAFTLVEILVVAIIIGILAGILLPAVHSVRVRAQMAATSTLIRSIGAACHAYESDYGYFPPVGLHDNAPTEPNLHEDIDKPAEVLWWFLTRQTRRAYAGSTVVNFNQDPSVFPGPAAGYNWDDPVIYGTRDTGPYFSVQRGQLRDFDNDGVLEIVDTWGNPLLYNPGGGEFGELLPDGTRRPFHNRLTFDLFSVGPNGTTREADPDYRFSSRVLGAPSAEIETRYEEWVAFCLGSDEGGNDIPGGNPLGGNYTERDQDDINNWH